MNIDDRTLSEEGLIDAALYQGMWELQRRVDKGDNVPMKRFTELLIWAKKQKSLLWSNQLESDQKKGWKIEERKWCGVPYHEFEIVDLGLYRD